MRYRAAQTLVYSRADGDLLACNFLAKTVFACDTDLIARVLPDRIAAKSMSKP